MLTWLRARVNSFVRRPNALALLIVDLACGAVLAMVLAFTSADSHATRTILGTILLGIAGVALAGLVLDRLRCENLKESARRNREHHFKAHLQEEADQERDVNLGEWLARRLEETEPRLRMDGVDLRNSVLVAVDLRRADLRRADLRGADLRRADLRGADLTDARLGGTELLGALYDAETTWPRGLGKPHGAIDVGVFE